MTVSAILDLKGHHVVTVHPDIALAEAIRVLTDRAIGAVVVLTDNGIEGILSERDVVHALGSRGAAALDAPVSQVMTRKVVTCRRADTVAGLMEVMTEQKFRHLPVVEHGLLVGLVSIGDVVKWRVGEYEAEQEALRDYIKTA
jgi:CBS domain-containing protein